MDYGHRRKSGDEEYKIIRSSNMREVLTHFLSLEGGKDKYIDKKEEFKNWRVLLDEEFFSKVCDFRDSRDDVNPVFTWTIGTKNNLHHRNIEKWVLADVFLISLYSNGIRQCMRNDLDKADGNLHSFVELSFACRYPEFRLEHLPDNGPHQTLIGIASKNSNRNGSIEIIDGVHRAISMISHGVQKTTAFLGIHY